jgi:hypothetical protein
MAAAALSCLQGEPRCVAQANYIAVDCYKTTSCSCHNLPVILAAAAAAAAGAVCALQGEPRCVAQAIYIVTAAVDRYKELCEGRYSGETCSAILLFLLVAFIHTFTHLKQ